MKFSLFAFAFAIFSLSVNATNYYVDAATNATTQNGSLSNPWKTLSQVNSNMGSFNPGDFISFKRGGTYPGGQLTVSRSGTAGNPITFNAYGTGADPIFSGTGSTINALFYVNNRSYITFDGLNITDPSLSQTDRSQMAKIQRVFYIDGSSNNIVMKRCKISLAGVAVYLVGPNNTIDSCRIENLRMVVNTNDGGYDDYGANPVVVSSANNKITRNQFLSCWADSYDFVYDGGAVEFFGPNTNNNFVAYNTMYDNNGCVEFGSSNGGTSSGNVFAYNKLINNASLFYINNSGPFAITVSNLQFYNNVIVETSAPRLFYNYMSSMASSSSSANIAISKNNIYWLTTGVDVARSGQFSGTQLNHGNNIYRLGTGSTVNYTLNSSELTTTATNIFTSTSGSNPTDWNYTLPTGSPAIDFGTDVNIEYDFNGNAVPSVPNAGVYEGGTTTSPTLNATATAGAILCNAGTTTVTVSATGGKTPYTGTGTFTVSAGTYTYTVTDALGVVKTVSVTVTQPATVSVLLNAGIINIAGGTTTLTVTASGGSGSGYSYKLNSGAYQTSNILTAVPVGTHTVTVKDANGCTATKNITIALTVGGSPLVISAVAGTIVCNGGTTTVAMSASGGTAPYTGTGNFTVPAGTFTYVVTDAAGTSQTTSITIAQPSAMVVTLSAGTITSAGGTTTITVNATGGAGTNTYKLNSGAYQSGTVFSGVIAGTHTVTVKDKNGCTKTKTISITQPSSGGTLSLALVSVTNITCKGKRNGVIRVNATGGTAPYQYKTQWIPYSSDNYFTNLYPGNYTVTVKDATGATKIISATVQNSTVSCASIGGRDVVDTANQLKTLPAIPVLQFSVMAYPNPSTNNFQLRIENSTEGEMVLDVTDLSGRRVYQSKGNASKSFIFGEQLQAGTYIVRITQGGAVATTKIIKM